jgi:hypothetical protein
MPISINTPSITLETILNKVSEYDIAHHYFSVNYVPCIIRSPLRKDNHPSFGFYSTDGIKIRYRDFATKESGGLFDLLEKYWNVGYNKVLEHIYKDLPYMVNTKGNIQVSKGAENIHNESFLSRVDVNLECRVRDWEPYDIEYWKSYGITLEWLKYADVYPISHKIITKGDRTYTFKADKYAYAFAEFKEDKVTLKIYQPFNKNGYKWSNKHDSSVVSLWTKIPEYGDKLCICSSLKDSLCLWCNTRIPAIAPQGEGYKMSDTAIKELKRRYKQIYILFDNDAPGIKDGEEFSKETGFKNIVLPPFNGGKDISDYYKSLDDKSLFSINMLSLFKD